MALSESSFSRRSGCRDRCGGTNIRAKAVNTYGMTLFEGSSGPANLTTTPQEEMASNVLSALDGCPSPSAKAGCFAGIGSRSGAALARRLLEDRFPGAVLGLFPDYVAAMIVRLLFALPTNLHCRLAPWDVWRVT